MQTISRAILLLRCFEEGADSIPLAELTRRAGLNKVTTYRLAEALVKEGLLNKSADSSFYSISYGLISLGRALLDPLGLISSAQPILKAVQEATGETAIINLREGQYAVVLGEILSPQPVRFSLGLGYRVDLRVGAAGWAILSKMQDWEVRDILESSAVLHADGSTMQVSEIEAGLSQTSERGFAMTNSQRVRDAAGYAAPFLGPGGVVAGSLAVIMPSSRNKKAERQELFINTICRAASDLTSLLGATPDNNQ